MEGVINSPKGLVEISKMRKLDEARRNWHANARNMSSFHYSPMGSSSGLPSIKGSESSSPLAKLKTFGKRIDCHTSEGS